MLLMLAFVVVDLALQTRQFRRHHGAVAAQGVEGLKQLLAGRELGEDGENLSAFAEALTYVEGRRAGFAVFDREGEIISATPLAFSEKREEMSALFADVGLDETLTYRRTVAGNPLYAGAARFESRDDPPVEGVAVYLINTADHRQTALFLWAWRSFVVLIIVIGVMLAVRIPVRKFVLEPMDGLFVGAYAASKDDYRELPKCPVQNEFVDLYEMFNRLMSHLSDTRIFEASLLEEEAGGADDERPTDK
jgi:hypothetical protein